MHKIHPFLGVILSLFMIGSSGGLASISAVEPQTFANEGTEVSVDTSAGDTQSPENEAVVESPALPPENESASDSAPVVVNSAVVPEDTSSEANPSTSSPSEEVVVEDQVDDESVLEEQVADEPAVDESADVQSDEADDVVADDAGNSVSETTSDSEPSMSLQAATYPYTINVANLDDEPISGAFVAITNYDGDVTYGSGTTINGSITFQLEPSDEYYAHVTAEGYADEEGYGFYVHADMEYPSSTIRLHGNLPGTLTMTILEWDTNAPIEGAVVAVTDDSGFAHASGKTNANGVYVSTEIIPGGQAYITVSHGNYSSDSTSVWISGNTVYPYDFHLRPIVGGTITFTAYDTLSDNQTPLAGVAVNVVSWDDETREYNGTTSSDGKLTFENLPGGEYSVTATLSGYEVREQKLEVHGNANEDLPMRKLNENPGTLTIKTQDFDGNPINGAVIVVYDSDGNQETSGESIGGQFTTGELKFGYYSVVITKDGYHDYEESAVYVNGDSSYTAHLQKVLTGTFTLEVLNSNNDQPVGDATVKVTHNTQSEPLVLTTDEHGIVTFEATSLGYYDIEVTKEGFAEGGGLYTYSGPDRQRIFFRELQSGIATITIRDTTTNDRLSDVDYEIIGGPDDKRVASGTTGADGTIITPVLEEGGYVVNLTKEGYFTVSPTFGIAGDTSLAFYLEQIQSGVLTVQALTLLDVPITNGTVYVFEAIVDGIVPGDGSIGVRYIPGEFIMSGPLDSNGRVPTGVLESGSYLVFIEAEGYETHSGVVHMNGDYPYSVNLVEGVSTPVDPGDPTTPTPTQPVETPAPTTPVETPSPTTPVETPAPTTPVETPSPTTPVETPAPTTPVETPIPTTPVETPAPTTPVETPAPTTPVETPEPTTPVETPAPTTPAETPIPTTPVETPEPGVDPGNNLGVLSVGLALCSDDDCDTQYDGYTVTWSVTPLKSTATDEIDSAKMAAVGMSAAPVSLASMQQAQSFSITAVIQDGLAVGSSGEIPMGAYNVCLNPVITGPNGETASIATDAICSDVDVTANGNILLPFIGQSGEIDAGDPTEVDDENGETDGDGNSDGDSDESTTPSSPDSDDQANSGGESTNEKTASADPVSKLPSAGTGTGIADGPSHGYIIVMLFILTLLITATKRIRLHRA